jgi:hypothetical protein
MVRYTLTAFSAALSMFAGGVANAQATNSATTTVPNQAGPDDPGEVLCAGMAKGFERIKVRRQSSAGIELGISRDGGCDSRSMYWRLDAIGDGDSIRVRKNCHAFRIQMEKLRRRPRTYTLDPAAVQSGPFLIEDFSGVFQLQSQNGRREAERWVRQTLALVRPCWGISTDDDAHLLDHLYAEIAPGPR